MSGICDFLISRSPEQILIEAPAIVIVEAKKADLKVGLGQCAAEMVAVQKFNEINNIPIATIYGSVSSGTAWRFLKLESKTLTIDLNDYPVPRWNRCWGCWFGWFATVRAIGFKLNFKLIVDRPLPFTVHSAIL